MRTIVRRTRSRFPNNVMFIKRALDLLLASVAVMVLSPLLVACWLTVWLSMGSPVLFLQTRPGYRGKPFTIMKFRTMLECPSTGAPPPDAERLTWVGRLLRKTSLDELPELFNVLRGEMSLVGPRPLLVEYLDRYTPEQARRHDVLPGLTGWAQINGRNNIDWEDKLALDVWYVDHRSTQLDLWILLRTIGIVLSGRGVNKAGHQTTDRFNDVSEGARD